MRLLQGVAEVYNGAAGPSASEWRGILILMGAGISTVFGALVIAFKARADDLKEQIARQETARKEDDAAHERALQAERDRTVRAEKTADDAMSKLASTLQLTAEQTAAIREFGNIVKESAVESRRTQERLDLVVRTGEDLRRALSEVRWASRHQGPPEPRAES